MSNYYKLIIQTRKKGYKPANYHCLAQAPEQLAAVEEAKKVIVNSLKEKGIEDTEVRILSAHKIEVDFVVTVNEPEIKENENS